MSKIKVGIVGGTGYTGVELLRLLAAHPEVALTAVTSRSEKGTRVSDIYPSLRGYVDLAFSEPDLDTLSECDLVFFATPNGVAMKMVPLLLERGIRVIDLAADFRLQDAAEWQQWYGMEHACPALLDEAVYGLPEINREVIAKSRLVANPGCYPTAVQLGVLPLMREGLVSGTIIADAKSGVSGAGRQANVGTLLCEAGDSFKAYGVPGHRHLPEIRQGLNRVSGQSQELVFVPHLVPMIRGIHATTYISVPDRSVDLQTLYERSYADEPFVDVMPAGSHPDTRSVRGSNICRIAVHRPGDGDTIVVLSVIDNLVKGAAGQGLQNFNIMFGFEPAMGLKHVPLAP